MNSIFKILAFVIILVTSIASVTATCEMEPNDSMDAPQVIDEETLNGTVSDSLPDRDIYRVDMSKGDLHIIILKKKNTNLSQLKMAAYDENKDPIPGSGTSLRIPGEYSDQGYIPQSDISYYFVVSGEGSYSIEHVHHETNDPNDNGDIYDIVTLEDGNLISGKVMKIDEMKGGGYEYVDLDRYKVNMDTAEELTVTVTRKDSEGEMYVELSSRNRNHVENITLEDKGQEEKFEYIADTYSPQDVFITISGKGDYEIDIEKRGGPQEDDLLLTFSFCGMFVCLPFLGFLMIIIIIIVVIVILVKANKD